MRFLVSVALLLVPGRVCADEAIRTNGQRVEGRLSLRAVGQLQFTPAGKDTPLGLDLIQDIRFPDGDLAPFLIAMPHRVELANEQRLTGELLGLDTDFVRFRTHWAKELKLPRRNVVAVTQPFGLTTIFHEGFDADPIRMQLTGSPPLDDKDCTSGRRSLVLNGIGQSALYKLPAPLEAGRIGLHYRNADKASGARWLVEAEFANANASRVVGVVLGGEKEAYLAEGDLPSGETRRVAQLEGWHRLCIRFTADYMLVGVDDRLLFESSKQGPGAPLKQVRLICKKRGSEDSPRGAVQFDDLTVARTLEPLAHPTGDPTQDELWLASGDQLFGQVDGADRRSVKLRAQAGKREIAWADLRGIYLKGRVAEPRWIQGTRVRIWFNSGLGNEPDQLEGVLEKFGEQKLTLHQDVLGRVELDRASLTRLRPLPSQH
jgi:hypothetical protein